ncbi:formylglycine-generating enzyme family protein [Sulfitobacter sp.]|jgi:formylglycine-generating enzyme required for sulfatase activity|uniref:formylglycine-generating enzyme family protein n=1 Tax=Sulfitobacter sp. TaxID=1903071 RepID=UPI0030027ED0
MTKAKPFTAVRGIKMGIALGVALIGASHYLGGPDAAMDPEFQISTIQLNDGRNLKVQAREVTVAQWQACHAAGFCTLDLSSRTQTVDYPATGLSFPDAMEYISWLNTTTKGRWRLPTAAEWQELAAEVLPQKPDPIFTDPSLTWASAYLTDANRTGRTLRPSGAFTATSAGIEDLDGNVWEWTQDCYAGASGQGAANGGDRCPAFIMGGEHEAVMSYLVRDPARGGCAVGSPPAHLGMRLVSDR